MSRLAYGFDGVSVSVTTNANGAPLCVNGAPVVQIVSHHREWIGVLDGEPQRDVWRVQAGRSLCELHFLSFPAEDDEPVIGTWLLIRWED